MEGMTRRKKATAWRECQLGEMARYMEGMPTRKKDTPHGRNDN
jgi:hypothetical protein